MPELPEVETVRIQLASALVGKTVQSVEVFHDKSVAYNEAIEDQLIGKTIATVDRIGKLLIVAFQDEPDLFLLAHLKMTGQFLLVDADGITGGGHTMTARDWGELPGRHTRVAFYFSDHSALYFNDMRLFGYCKVVDRVAMEAARATFGPEPISEGFSVDWFVSAVRKRNAPIKAVLLDQSFVAGLGNIYVDEALFRAGVRPTRKASRLTKAEARRVAEAATAVLEESVAVGGTTFQHFVDTGGKNGNFTDYLQVFGKQGSACIRCGTEIKKIRVAGRGTHYCPQCQR